MSPLRAAGLALLGACAVAPLLAARSTDLAVRVLTNGGSPSADAVVYAVPAQPASHDALPPAVIDQVDRQFLPRVNVVQAGTAVNFPNSDNIRHSVYSFSPAKVFTLKLYAGQSANSIVFDKPGIVVLGCNIHDSMVAWLLVVDTPFYGRTDNYGSVVLSHLAPGDYRLYVWHEPMRQEQLAQMLHVPAKHSLAPITLRLPSTPAVDWTSMPGMPH